MKYSDCCWVPIVENLVTPMCSACLEHCVVVTDSPEIERMKYSQLPSDNCGRAIKGDK